MSTTTAKSKKKQASVEDAIAEMSGVRVCDAPGCFRQLRSTEGKKTIAGERTLHTCYGVSCLSYAQRLADIHAVEAS